MKRLDLKVQILFVVWDLNHDLDHLSRDSPAYDAHYRKRKEENKNDSRNPAKANSFQQGDEGGE